MCDSPFYVDAPVGSGLPKIPVPCGKCPPCMLRRINSWVFRLTQEERISTSSAFVTLTYDTDYVPITPRGYMTLQRRDPQLFFKRLRKAHPKGTRIKYYLAGEYGGKTWRPHYHVILFGADLSLVNDAWGLGAVHIGQVTEASIAYTAKYISKGSRVPQHKGDDRVKEFSLMSKKLGANFLTPQQVAYHKADLTRVCLTTSGGNRIAMPRYYKEKIYSESERRLQAQLARSIATQDDLILETEFYRLYGHGSDYLRYVESCRSGRYIRFHGAPDKDCI